MKLSAQYYTMASMSFHELINILKWWGKSFFGGGKMFKMYCWWGKDGKVPQVLLKFCLLKYHANLLQLPVEPGLIKARVSPYVSNGDPKDLPLC